MSALDRYKPPGRLISVDDGQVHIVEAGAGSPTVVFESGMGGGLLEPADGDVRLSGGSRRG